MRRLFSFLSGVFCGAIVGSAAALLLAPASGRELQAQGRAKAEQLVQEVRRAYEEKQAELKTQLEELKAPKRAP